MGKKRYFAAESAHGNESSHGFSNDTIVRVFSSRTARDAYVEESRNVSCHAIAARLATSFAANWSMTHNCNIAPRPFSEEFWGIVTDADNDLSCCLGTLEVCRPDDEQFCGATRLYR